MLLPPRTVNNTNLRLALAKATKMANQTEFSYAINAARRSEKRCVHNTGARKGLVPS